MDDLLPNDGTYYHTEEPEEQKQENLVERGKVQAGQLILADELERLGERIAFYDSLKSIPTGVRSDERLFMLTVSANEMTQANLIQERDLLKQMLDEHTS